MSITSIRQVISGRPLEHIGPEATLREACRKLHANDIGALAVLENGRLIGIPSERDVICRGVSRDRPMDGTTVAEAMTRAPRTVDIGATLPEAQALMSRGGFRHLPVTENGAPVGMLSFRDIPTEYRLMFERYEEYRAEHQRAC